MLRSFELPEPMSIRTDGDVNTVEGWLIPFNQVADVADITDDGVDRYREAFRPGSCTRMEQAVAQRGNAGFIRLTLDHESSMDARVGCGRSLEQRGSEGLWGSFKLYESADLAKVRSMIEDSHDSFSIEFNDVAPPEEVDGVRWRRQVTIPAVTLTPMPAYEGAKVLTLRDGEVDVSTAARDEVLAWLKDDEK